MKIWDWFPTARQQQTANKTRTSQTQRGSLTVDVILCKSVIPRCRGEGGRGLARAVGALGQDCAQFIRFTANVLNIWIMHVSDFKQKLLGLTSIQPVVVFPLHLVGSFLALWPETCTFNELVTLNCPPVSESIFVSG